MFQFSFSSVMVFFLISSMRWLRFLLFLMESRVILLSVYIVIVLGTFLISLLPVVLLLLPFALPDYMSICRGVCVSFGVLIRSVCTGCNRRNVETSGECSLC